MLQGLGFGIQGRGFGVLGLGLGLPHLLEQRQFGFWNLLKVQQVCNITLDVVIIGSRIRMPD